jgi:hypothetical protein
MNPRLPGIGRPGSSTAVKFATTSAKVSSRTLSEAEGEEVCGCSCLCISKRPISLQALTVLHSIAVMATFLDPQAGVTSESATTRELKRLS